MKKVLQPLSRKDLYAVMLGLLKRQSGKCALCGEPISLEVRGAKSNYAVDHDHKTGEIRGVLHKSCNAAEGKVFNAAARWGAKSTDPEAVLTFLQRLISYYATSGTGIMYPDHKTPEQIKEAQRIKRNKTAAVKRAKERQQQVGVTK